MPTALKTSKTEKPNWAFAPAMAVSVYNAERTLKAIQ